MVSNNKGKVGKNVMNEADLRAFLPKMKNQLARDYPALVDRLSQTLGMDPAHVAYSTRELGLANQETLGLCFDTLRRPL